MKKLVQVGLRQLRETLFRSKIATMFVPRTLQPLDSLMDGILRIGMIVVAGSMMLPLGACSRTSDGTIVVDKPAALPSFNIMPAKPLIPSWMKRKAPEPVYAARNFPPPPAERTAPRRKTRPPVVTTGSGNLACKNVSEGGRVRMVCE
jgi:hypothetical protein